MTMSSLSDPTWRDQMRLAGVARTQVFAQELAGAGYGVLLVRSFAAGASDEDLNLVLWRWGTGATERLVLVDDERRL